MFVFLSTLLIVTGLIGVLYGWILVRTSHERIVISLEVAKVSAAIHKVNDVALNVLHRAKDFWG
jgi:hypothetical protein